MGRGLMDVMLHVCDGGNGDKSDNIRVAFGLLLVHVQVRCWRRSRGRRWLCSGVVVWRVVVVVRLSHSSFFESKTTHFSWHEKHKSGARPPKAAKRERERESALSSFTGLGEMGSVSDMSVCKPLVLSEGSTVDGFCTPILRFVIRGSLLGALGRVAYVSSSLHMASGIWLRG